MIYVDEVMEGVFALMPREEFPNDCELIHTTLYNLKTEYPKLMDGFSFDMDRPFPYCEEIEFGIFGLQLGKMMGSYMDTYRRNPSLLRHFKNRTSKKFSQEELGKLEQLAREFSDELDKRAAA